MGDGSEDPSDILPMMEKSNEGYDLVLSCRFGKNSKLFGYPKAKYWANRLMNAVLAIIFRIKSKDITNAFTAYNRDQLESVELKTLGFELSIEMPIKMIRNGARYTSVDVVWKNREEKI